MKQRASALVEQLIPQWTPDVRAAVLAELYAPAVDWWQACLSVRRDAGAGPPLVASVGGLPGTGKSTLVAVTAELLSALFRWRVVALSLDDLYLTRDERERLARSIHPLLLNRGVPGTHDTKWGLRLVEQLMKQKAGESTSLPRFDKILDDRLEESSWPCFVGRPDLIVCEGWCWGARPIDVRLDTPENPREASEDPAGIWRRYVLEQLSQGYPELFELSLVHIQLASPHFEASLQWRITQEKQAYVERGRRPEEVQSARLAAFLQLFQRVARYPRMSRCAVTAELDDKHRIAAWRSG